MVYKHEAGAVNNHQAGMRFESDCIERLSVGMKILEDAPIILVSLDMRGYIVYLNNAWEKFLGYHRDEGMHKPIVKFICCQGDAHVDFEQIKPGVGCALRVHKLPLLSRCGEVRQFEYAAYCIGSAIYAYLSPLQRFDNVSSAAWDASISLSSGRSVLGCVR